LRRTPCDWVIRFHLFFTVSGYSLNGFGQQHSEKAGVSAVKKWRQLHVWIGLLCSVLILMESITGLLLSEPWLIGMEGREGMRGHQAVSLGRDASTAADENAANGSVDSSATPPFHGSPEGFPSAPPQGGNSLMGLVRQLHEGRIGGMDVKWLADLAAVSMIILTVTGITLSINTLRAQRISRTKRLQMQGNPGEG
jgi:hypothetical protein